MEEILKKIGELLPIVRESPTWFQYVFLLWISVTAVFLVGLVIILTNRVGDFAVSNLTENQSILDRQFGLTGKGLPSDGRLEIKVYRIEDGSREEVTQDGKTLRNEDGTWRFEFLTFRTDGEHEVNVRLLRKPKPFDFWTPFEFVYGPELKSLRLPPRPPSLRLNRRGLEPVSTTFRSG